MSAHGAPPTTEPQPVGAALDGCYRRGETSVRFALLGGLLLPDFFGRSLLRRSVGGWECPSHRLPLSWLPRCSRWSRSPPRRRARLRGCPTARAVNWSRVCARPATVPT